jgi:hypothetical protein
VITALHASMRFPFATDTNKKRMLTICGFINNYEEFVFFERALPPHASEELLTWICD